MEHPESSHPLAAWIRRPIGFAAATTVLGGLAFGLALLLPVGLIAVALAAAGAVGAVTGLLTMLVLIVARATGRHETPQAVEPGRQGAVLPGSGEPGIGPESALDPVAATSGAAPPVAATPVAATAGAASPRAAAPAAAPAPVPIEDQPTQPLVLDLTDDRRHSASR